MIHACFDASAKACKSKDDKIAQVCVENFLKTDQIEFVLKFADI